VRATTIRQLTRRRAAVAALCLAPLLPGAGAGQEASTRAFDVVIHYWPGQDRLAASLLPGEQAVRFPGLPADVLQRGEDVTVLLAPDAARWDSLTGGRAPDWGAGIALPERGIIILPGYVSDRGGTHTLPIIMRHELAHIALRRHIGGPIPRWFNEGYATWSAGQLDADAGWLMRLAFLTNRAPPLDSLTLDWPLLAADARLAYLLSASAVQYLVSLGSPGTFERFLERWAATQSFEEALREVYVLASPQFERLWRTHVRRNYGWLQLLAQSMFVWTVITLLVLVLFIIRRRRDRRRLALLQASEPPDEPAWWMESPNDSGTAEDVADEPEPGDGERPPGA
jgi:hypothetical protein